MLRIAVQSKGRLFEDTMALLAEAGIKVSSSKRTLLVQSSNFPVEILYLRDDDIPQSVASGVADLGIVGQNEYEEEFHKAAKVAYRRKKNSNGSVTTWYEFNDDQEEIRKKYFEREKELAGQQLGKQKEALQQLISHLELLWD